MVVHRRLLNELQTYVQERNHIENLAREFEQRLRLSTRGVISIPVVVHVVWNTPEQNISDAQIQSQIDVLNRDYRKQNVDTSQVPSVWQRLVSDARINFHLATKDFNGDTTTGITRTRTTVSSFSDDDQVKSSRHGGAPPWPADRYLNIWVCLLAKVLGYAQFPGGPAETDGVVIDYSAFGTIGTASPPFNKGRTATHEIGHWLNLYHIWGDDGTGCLGTDNVEDTPNQGGPNYGQPKFPHISCSNDPHGDMFMNYMDYVDDSSMVMFTAGQIARIDACLEGPRASFLQADEEPGEEPGPVTATHTIWSHGVSMQIEYPDRLRSAHCIGYCMRVEGNPHTSNWFHFAIQAPVQVNEKAIQVDSVMIRFRTESDHTFVHAIQVFDGETRIASHEDLSLAAQSWSVQRIDLSNQPYIKWGINIAVGVKFESDQPAESQMEFSAVGCEFLL
jgi:hypothetical protein